MVTEAEIKNWYNNRHRSLGEDAWRSVDAYPVFLDHLGVEPGRSLLDVGCGTGYLLKVADERGLETHGVDISEEGVEIAKTTSPNSGILLGKGEDLPFPDNSFDYVICLGALKHFLDLDKGIREMMRVAKQDASFCIVVPNSRFLLWKIRGNRGTEQQDINENLMSLKEWTSIFEKQGLQILEVRKDKLTATKSRGSALPKGLQIIGALVQKLIWTLLPLNLTYQFIFIMRKSSVSAEPSAQAQSAD